MPKERAKPSRVKKPTAAEKSASVLSVVGAALPAIGGVISAVASQFERSQGESRIRDAVDSLDRSVTDQEDEVHAISVALVRQAWDLRETKLWNAHLRSPEGKEPPDHADIRPWFYVVIGDALDLSDEDVRAAVRDPEGEASNGKWFVRKSDFFDFRATRLRSAYGDENLVRVQLEPEVKVSIQIQCLDIARQLLVQWHPKGMPSDSLARLFGMHPWAAEVMLRGCELLSDGQGCYSFRRDGRKYYAWSPTPDR